jgi:hypothetical protein
MAAIGANVGRSVEAFIPERDMEGHRELGVSAVLSVC